MNNCNVSHGLSRSSTFVVFLAGLLIWSAGCVQVEQTLTLEPEGSGTMQITFGVSEATAARMSEMARESGLQTEAEGFPSTFSEKDIRQDFKDYEKYGVILQSVKIESKNGWKYQHLEVHFESLDGLAQTPLMSDHEISLRRTAEGHYEFLQTATEMMPPDATQSVQMQEMMKGFKAALRIRTPGAILESNAPEHSEREAAWVFDLDKDPEAIKKAENVTIRIVFDGKGLNIPEFQKSSASR
jgi:hypothetical protein